MGSNTTATTSRRRLFAQNFMKHPRMLGSLIPSSRFLVDELLGEVDWLQARVIVEYGPGVGAFTGQILKRMRREARLVVLEMNTDFVDYLSRQYSDPRLIVENRSAADVEAVLREHALPAADYIISGIPFSTLEPEQRDGILRSTHTVLSPEGRFLVYQFSGRVLPHLREQFGVVKTDFELLNILPARLFYCSR
jgi:phospholipid N-methyltransferase